ncbi:MAG: bifunctional hydroxymethylpyrimidine kinase/phosphomethylpyrimidine kinase [Methanomassiliicoccaceae archaeon]|nr:bifunctional hydroxymethylpyrimidine kinase/phosphomethylpyrimidine kinase [Methanomassiliicoccaceae archaeon]
MMRCALSVAGSDSIGGAGIQADIKAMASLGVHPHTVITAVTAQNTVAVRSITPLPCEVITAQLNAVLGDSDVRSAKTGMLYSPDIVDVIAESLSGSSIPVIADPVLVAGVGDSLAAKGLADSIKRRLIPMCELVTPNRYEAEAISGIDIKNENDAMRACELIGKGGTSVYLKGGHMETASVIDLLYHKGKFRRFEHPRLERAGHGGGCTLSAYITAYMANGKEMTDAIVSARGMIQRSIASMYSTGEGNKMVNSAVNMKQLYTKNDITNGMDVLIDRILKIIPGIWIPSVGMNIAYAAAGAEDVMDVAAVQGKIFSVDGMPVRAGPVMFGAAEHISHMILAAMRSDRDVRAAVNIRHDENILKAVKEAGMDVTSFNRVKHPLADIGELTALAIEAHGSVPDAISDPGTDGKGMIRIFGTDIDDIGRKTGMIVSRMKHKDL